MMMMMDGGTARTVRTGGHRARMCVRVRVAPILFLLVFSRFSAALSAVLDRKERHSLLLSVPFAKETETLVVLTGKKTVTTPSVSKYKHSLTFFIMFDHSSYSKNL
jgi:hypothetical protein